MFRIENIKDINYKELEKYLFKKFLFITEINKRNYYKNHNKELKQHIKYFITDLKLNLKIKNYEKIIKFYNYLNFIDLDSISIKKNNTYYIKKFNHKTNRLKKYKINLAEIIEKLINQLVYNQKRFILYYRYKEKHIKEINKKLSKDLIKNNIINYGYYNKSINYNDKKLKSLYFNSKNYKNVLTVNKNDIKKINHIDYYKRSYY